MTRAYYNPGPLTSFLLLLLKLVTLITPNLKGFLRSIVWYILRVLSLYVFTFLSTYFSLFYIAIMSSK
jgi:hypothetical protein